MELEMTESIEVDDNCSLRKRKAETHDLKDHSDGDGHADEGSDAVSGSKGSDVVNGEGGGSSGSDVVIGERAVSQGSNDGGGGGEDEVFHDSDLEWGYNSFDCGYYSLREGLTDSDDDPDDRILLKNYRRLIFKTEGFNLDGVIYPKNIWNTLRVADLDKSDHYPIGYMTGREYMEKMVQLVLDRYNLEKNTNIKCKSIVRAVYKMVSGYKSYITFMAENPDGEVAEYQAKTNWYVWYKRVAPLFCRPAPGQKDLSIIKREDAQNECAT